MLSNKANRRFIRSKTLLARSVHCRYDMNAANDKVTMTEELASVVAYRHEDLPGFKVQTSPDCPTDAASEWSAFATRDGDTLLQFAGKSFKNRKSAERAIRNFFDVQIAKSVG